MKIGVLAGTFDPVHLGHLILAEDAAYTLALDKILWVLTPDPPHKKGRSILCWKDRWRLLSLAVTGNPIFELSSVDILRIPPYFAVDTMRQVKEQYPTEQLFYLMGADSLRDLPMWHQPAKLVEICDGLGVVMRPGITIDHDELEIHIPGIWEKVRVVSTSALEISSSNIRGRIASGKPYRYFLPPAVYEYILDHQLYLD